MLANVTHSPAWKSQGHVCLACRHQRLRAHRRRRPLEARSQVRWHGAVTSTHSTPATDSWFDTLNDISDIYSPSKKPSAKPSIDHTSAKSKQVVKARKLESSLSWQSERQSQSKSLSGLRASLDTRVSGSSQRLTRRVRARTQDAKREPLSRTLPVTSKQLAQRLPEELPGSSKNEVARVEGAVPSASQLQALIAELKVERDIKLAEVKEQTGGNSSKVADAANSEQIEEAGPRPFPTFTGTSTPKSLRNLPVDHIAVPAGQTVERGAAKESVGTKRGGLYQSDSQPKLWRAKTSPSASGLGGPIPVPLAAKGSLLERLQMPKKAQNPYGVQKGKLERSPDSASFSSFRKADRISPYLPYSSSVSAAPFGFTSPESRSGLDASNPDFSESAVATPEPSVSAKLISPRRGLNGNPERSFERTGSRIVGREQISKDDENLTMDKPQPLERQNSVSDDGPQSLAEDFQLHTRSAPESTSISDQTTDFNNVIGHSATTTSNVLEQDANMPVERPEEGADLAHSRLAALHSTRDLPTTTANIRVDQFPAPTEIQAGPDGASDNPSEQNVSFLSATSEGTSDAESPKFPSFPSPPNTLEDTDLEALRTNTTPKHLAAPGVAAQETKLVDSSAKASLKPQLSRKQHRALLLQRRKERKALKSSAGASTATASAEVETVMSDSGNGGSDDPPDASAGLSIANAMKATRTRRSRQSKDVSQEPKTEREESSLTTQAGGESLVASITPSQLQIDPLDITQPHVPYLEYNLDRVLFNQGVYQLQDPASRVYNFDPYLQKIMPVLEFDFDSLKEYKTSSKDTALSALAKDHNKRYIGSTSSMTSSLAHFHYLLSNFRPLNLDMLSKGFISASTKMTMTEINRAPSAIFLRWKNGTYAIDADKEFDSANVLMLLGKSMELLLTLPKSEYERYRKSDPREVSEEQRTAPESYQYTTMRDFLMRSQLDAYDPRLPENGTFDLKTRAVVSVRMQSKDFEPMTGYEIFTLQGKWNSYEREYYDMLRSTMLKYMLQARMGRMTGIFVAYHNVKRIFGFQYIPIHEMDRALHGQSDTRLGDQEFRASLDLMNEVMNKATAKFPEQSLRIHFETQSESSKGMPTALHVFAEPMTEENIDRIQDSQKAKVAEWEREIMGKNTDGTSDGTVNLAMSASDGMAGTVEDSSGHDEAATASKSNLVLGSSDSNADKEFLSSIEKSSNDELKPLFYATIIVQSRVNGEVVAERPTNLGQDDKWEVDYILKEYDIGRPQWALYEDMKARRKSKFAEPEEDEDEGNPDYFIRLLKSLSDKSRETRTRIDESDAERDIIEMEQPLLRIREKIDCIEDYTSWLYRQQGKA